MSHSDGGGTSSLDQRDVLAAVFPGCHPRVARLLLAQAPLVVALLGPDLSLLFSNECGLGPTEDGPIVREALVGRGDSRMLPAMLVEERATYVRQVLQTGMTLCVTGMIRGCLIRTIYLRMECEGRPAVLVVAFRVTEFGEPPAFEADRAGADGLTLIRARNDDLGHLEELTERELQVLRYIGQGLTAAEIGKLLHRAVKTVEGHRVSLGTKLRLKGKADLVRTAISCGLTALDDREVVLLAKQARLTRELA